MAIIFGGDAGIRENSYSGFVNEIVGTFNNVVGTFKNALKGQGPPAPPKENVYVDTGFSNVPGTSFVGSTVDNVDDIKRRHIISQEPSLTVYIKKRAFWGLSSANDSRLMDDGEKLFMRAAKILFEKKCNQIAAYEALTKMSRLVSEDADLDVSHLSVLSELIETTRDSAYGLIDDIGYAEKLSDPNNISHVANVDQVVLENKNSVSASIEDLLEGIETLKRRQSKLKQATNTTWVIDPDVKDIHGVGRGSGVIELTLVSSINTSLGIEGGGRFNFTVQDPYNLMKITTDDVEVALSAAKLESDIFKDSDKYGEIVDLKGPSTILEQAREKELELRRIRENKIADLLGFDRTIIGESKAAEVVFEISPSSYSTDRVIAYTTLNDNITFNKTNILSAMLQLPAEHQFGYEEVELINTIFNLLDEYTDAVQSLNTKIIDNNKQESVSYARRQMRIHYLGKSIVQPMDSVHVYMRGNTVHHNQLVGPLNTILNNTDFINSVAKNSDVSDAVIEEEMKQFGIDEIGIPREFYKSMRTSSFMRNAGAHVFGGVVSSVSESYNAGNGTYVLNVDGESNLKWLNLSRVNTSPSLVQPKGMLEDPLTPFKYETDDMTGLLKDEPELLDVNAELMYEGKVFDKHGVNDSRVVKSKSDLNQEFVAFEDQIRVIMKHAPGLVYKWKPGVSVATYNVNLATSLQGKKNDLDILKRYVGLNIVDRPFAGLDAADIVSLLVTGYPHSASRFYENSTGLGTFHASGSNAATSYFQSFFNITRTTNEALGRFKPFRAVGLEGRLLAKRMFLQSTLKEGYKKVDQLRQELATYRDKLLQVAAEPSALISDEDILSKRKTTEKSLEAIVSDLEDRITTEIKNQQELTDQAKKDNVITDTNDIVFKLDEIPSGLPSDAQEENEKTIRLKNKILQLRTQYDCKFGTDENLFIVSDQYDNDRDIQAFVKRLRQQQSLFNTQYQHPLQICEEVAGTIDFEFFCMSEDTIILTMGADGKIESKKICDFSAGDMVLSIDKESKNVEWKKARLIKRKLSKNEKMFQIRDGQGNIMKLSNKHRLLDSNMNEIFVEDITEHTKLCMADNVLNIEEDMSICIHKIFENNKWYEDLGDSFRIRGQGSRCRSVPKNIILDEDLSWLLGMYVAEGSVSDNENRKNKLYRGYHTIFSLGISEIDLANKISKIILEKFNIKSNIYKYEKYGRCTVDVGSFVFAKLIKNIFGRTLSHTKKIPSIIWRTNNKNKFAFVSGVLMGDGTLNRRFSISSKSKYLINDLSQILLMLGIDTKIDEYNKIHIYGKENMNMFTKYLSKWHYYDNIVKYCSSNNSFENRKITNRLKIKDICETKYNGFVYDLEVEDNHTFLIGTVWSHNCDTQGNIQFRPPQYNRVPLSLVLKMFLLNNKNGIQLYPNFIKAMFNSKVDGLRDDLKVLDLEIEIDAISLGLEPESDAVVDRIRTLVNEEDITGNVYFKPRANYSLGGESVIDNSAQLIVDKSNAVAGYTGRRSELQDFYKAKEQILALNDPENLQINSKRLSVANRLKSLVGRRQQVKTMLDKMEKRAGKFKDHSPFTNFSSKDVGDMLAPYQDLIEDDYNDFLGPGSSKRFIIYDDQIISSNFTESDRNAYCRVDVNGEIDLVGNQPGELVQGLPTVWAGATDFDMWRMYGYRSLSTQNKPFLKNAEEQCAPYALFLLNRARKDVVQGTITIPGNEYYQLGDVIYINSRDTLFYVWSVKHNFSYEGGTFTTTLECKYGHTLGEYIATPLDAIGKQLVKQQRKFNRTLISRETVSEPGGIHLGLVVFGGESAGTIDDEKREMLKEPYARFNVSELKRSLLTARNYITGSGVGDFPKVEVRGWISDESDREKVETRMEAVVDWLQHPRGRWMEYSRSEDMFIVLGKQYYDSKLEDNHLTNKIFEDDSDHEVKAVNLSKKLTGDDKSRKRIPNEEVYNASQTREPYNIIEMVLVLR